jgi:hypothetical protein
MSPGLFPASLAAGYRFERFSVSGLRF